MVKALLLLNLFALSFCLQANDNKTYERVYHLRKAMHQVNFRNNKIYSDEIIVEARKTFKWHREALLEKCTPKDPELNKLYLDAKSKYHIAQKNYSDGAAQEQFMKACFRVDAHLVKTKDQNPFPELYKNWHEHYCKVEDASLKSHRKELENADYKNFSSWVKELQKMRQP